MEQHRSNSLLRNVIGTGVTVGAAWALHQYWTYDRRWWWKRRAAQIGREVSHQPNWEEEYVHGFVAPGWERVRDEFVHNFRVRGELGAAVCVFFRGAKVVDLWGGFRDRSSKSAWQRDTLCPMFSVSKGISALILQMLVSNGRLDLDEKVCAYWPDFARNGKERVTVRDLIDHSVGLAGLTPPLTLEMLSGRDDKSKQAVRDHLARATMEWPGPGDYKGYMAITLGFYENELVQLTEGSGRQRTIGEYLREEVLLRLGLEDELYVSLPDTVPDSRLARLDGMCGLEPLWPNGAFPEGFMKKLITQPSSYTSRAFRSPQLSSAPSVMDYDRRDVKRIEMPAAGMQGTARAVAKLYSVVERVLNTEDDNDNNSPLPRSLLNKHALALFRQPAQPGRYRGWNDEILGVEACLGSGLLLPAPAEFRGTGRFVAAPGAAFGAPGAGGAMVFCDPDAELAFCYLPNRCGQLILDDPREFALRTKAYEAVQRIRSKSTGDDHGPDLDLQKLQTPHYLTKRYIDAYPELAPLP